MKEIHERSGTIALAFDHQHPRAHGSGEGRRFTEPSFAEDDPRRGRELEVQRGRSHSADSGYSARYFMLRRGSAIIGSTASRHVA